MGGNFQEGVMFVFAMNNEHLLPTADVIFHITILRRMKIQGVQKQVKELRKRITVGLYRNILFLCRKLKHMRWV